MKKLFLLDLSLMSLFLLMLVVKKKPNRPRSPKQPVVQQIAVGKDVPDLTLQLWMAKK